MSGRTSVCEPSLARKLSLTETKFVIDSIIFPQLIFSAASGFPLFRLHERLARECSRIKLGKGNASVSDDMDYDYAEHVAFYSAIGLPHPDLAAAGRWIGPRYEMISSILGEEDFIRMFEKVRHFYEAIDPPCFELPFDKAEFFRLMEPIDDKAGSVVEKADEARILFQYKSPYHYPSYCIHFLVQARLFSRYGYSYSASVPFAMLRSWQGIFAKLCSSLTKVDADLLRRVREAPTSDKTLRSLFGKRIGSLTTLLGFEPINPLRLLRGLPSPATDLERAVEVRNEVDGKILRVRKTAEIEKLRHLLAKVHDTCLEGDVKTAADRLAQLREMQPTSTVNRTILDEVGEFSQRKIVQRLEQQLEHQLSKELMRKEDIEWFSGYLGDVRLLISGLALTASYLELTGRLEQALAAVPALLIAPAAVARVMKASIRFLPGFGIYAAFHKWPRST